MRAVVWMTIATALLQSARACTMVAVGKKATHDGSVYLAHNDDAGGGASDLRLVRVPAQDHLLGSKRAVYNFFGGYPRIVTKERGKLYAPKDDGPRSSQDVTKPLGYIPQVKHTYAYWDQDYGLMNEKQLSLAESTCGARTVGWATDVPYGKNLFGIAELSKVALERCATARCAIKTMGDLAVEYGFYSEDSGDPNDPGYMDSAEALGIADREGEVWVFHVATGKNNASAVWAAQRLQDDHVTVIANGFTIREMDLDNPDWFMASPNVKSVAQDMGWWDPNQGPFNFAAAYGFQTVAPRLPLYVGRRVWRVLDLMAPSLKLDPRLGTFAEYNTYPFSVKPDRPMTLERMMALMRDYYQGTPFDLSQGLAAGPFHAPMRWDGSYNQSGGWERPISIYRTIYSAIMQSRSTERDAVGGVLWYAQSTPHTSVYVPLSCAQSSVPGSYLVGEQSRFNMMSAWWAFSFVKNWAMLRFNAINTPIQHELKLLQERAITLRKKIEDHVRQKSDEDAVEYIETHSNDFAERVVQHWWHLAWKLVGMFSDGYITTGESPDQMVTPGYPAWWLNATGFFRWPGNSYTPPLEDAETNSKLFRAQVSEMAISNDVVQPYTPAKAPEQAGLGWSHVIVAALVGVFVGVGGMVGVQTRRAEYRAIN